MPDINLLLNLLKEFAWLGNWLFFLLAFIESAPLVGVVIPGATLISVGGFLASQGILNTWNIILFATIGAILGDFFSYSLGRWGGKWMKDKKVINHRLLMQGERFFIKYGNKSVFWGRFFGPIRAIIPFVAGLSKMKKRPFIFWNIISAIGWATLNVFFGYFSGTLVITILKKWSSGLTLILIIILVITLFYWFIKQQELSLKKSFRTSSQNFINYLSHQNWFNKLNVKYPIIPLFLKENKYASEKLFGGTLVFSFLIIIYILIIIWDVF